MSKKTFEEKLKKALTEFKDTKKKKKLLDKVARNPSLYL